MQKEIFPKLKIETNKTEETKKCESIFEYAKEELNYIVSSTNVLNPLVEKHIDILEKSNIEKIQKELNYGENLVISVDLMGFGEAVQFRLIKSILNKVVPRATCYIEERSIDENDNNKGINLFPEYKNYIPADERKLCINDSNGSYQFWKKHRGSIEAGIWVIDDIEYDPLKDNNIFPMQLIKPFNIPSFSEKNKEITKQILKIKATEKVVTFGSMIDFATYQFDLIKECLKKKFKIILTPRLINDAEGYQERLGKSFPDKTIAFLSELKNDEQKNYDILIADTMGQLNLFYSISDIAIVEEGRNLLEPIYQKTPVLFLPSKTNEMQANFILEQGVGLDISDEVSFNKSGLNQKIEQCLNIKISNIEHFIKEYHPQNNVNLEEFNKKLNQIIQNLYIQKAFREENQKKLGEYCL